MPTTKLRFKYLFYCSRVPLAPNLQVSLKGWKKEDHNVDYGSIYIDEFRSDPNVKTFQYVHEDGTRFNYLSLIHI